MWVVSQDASDPRSQQTSLAGSYGDTECQAPLEESQG